MMKVDYSTVEFLPAEDLLILSHEELNDLIAQAKDQKAKASRVIQWLVAIRFEKRIREQAERDSQGEVE